MLTVDSNVNYNINNSLHVVNVYVYVLQLNSMHKVIHFYKIDLNL